MTTQRRRERERAQRRAEIIDAAELVFSRGGFERAKMSDVAQAAEVSKGALYLHFADKSALFAAVLERHYIGVIDAIEQSVTTGGTGLQQLWAIGETYARFISSHPGYARAFLHLLSAPDALVAQEALTTPDALAAAAREESLKAGALAAGHADGSVRGDLDVADLATLWPSLLAVSAFDLATGEHHAGHQRIGLRRVLRVHFRGWASDPQAAAALWSGGLDACPS